MKFTPCKSDSCAKKILSYCIADAYLIDYNKKGKKETQKQGLLAPHIVNMRLGRAFV